MHGKIIIHYTKKLENFQVLQFKRSCQMEFTYWRKKNNMTIDLHQYISIIKVSWTSIYL